VRVYEREVETHIETERDIRSEDYGEIRVPPDQVQRAARQVVLPKESRGPRAKEAMGRPQAQVQGENLCPETLTQAPSPFLL
jgi:hypothetical protein